MGIFGKIKFYTKSFVFGSLLLVCALYGVFASIILRIVGKEEYAQYTVARVFHFLFSKILGVKVTIKNEHLLQNPSVVVSNHQSALDILILGRLFQPGFTVTAKNSLKYVPFLGWFMLASKTFFLDRSKSEKARKVLGNALSVLKIQKRSIFMFPEGTRSAAKKLELLPFKKGAFHLAKQGRIPVTPVAVSNYSTIFHSGDKVFNQGEIVIEVLKPMSTENLKTNEDVTKFTNEVSEKMLKTIESLGYASTKAHKVKEAQRLAAESSDVQSDVSVEVVDETRPLISTD
ncbi:1-acylglycerol-3-phosphate O [Metschnikowia bicuspidata var. bicuspidata NRRL YB-4993]|uniref:1-acyl-sn-glycerol-3-phosphate acyltransferase n=1 Tax=Metschnikowia bicuspidata var. bicuspidata NRRL YB-4993 TaxID=869754 RepID=A0A1A0H4V8_9ASCO|nr:1-acylglycerol-3-phosphate O [Metschnikowia bicuspidata var. bicuspidata NRRL YB-4993]OBA19071.1 1-acylglycerol-3-phosphate O [Metschnikowia bicuspidata var. bicuspidata NRRL YB-4993]